MNQLVLLALLAALNVSSAVAVVFSKHISRQTHAEISRYQQEIDALDVQWSQLQIEESTFSEHGRIEQAASGRLGMVFPELNDTVMISR